MLHLLIWLLSQPAFWALVGVCLGPYLFFRGFRLLQLKRRIMNVPRSSIRSAAIGPVEISGTAVGPYTLLAPLSQRECLYYRMAIESNPRGDLQRQIRELCAPLFIDDGTGLVMVYPPGAELKFPPSYHRAEYGKLAVLLASRSGGETPEFSQEYSIAPGDKVFVLGTLCENRWLRRSSAAEANDLSRIGPGFVCAGEADLQRREVFPVLDPNLPSGSARDATDAFDLSPPVILMKGDGPFVISNESERDLLEKLGWKSLLCIWGGPIAAIWGIWELFVVRAGLNGSPFIN